MDKAFRDEMAAGYALTEPGLVLGSPMLGGELANDARVQVALCMINRHGLIAGATGTGKTKTLQLLAGQLSKAGVPVFVADIKGDLTGMAAPGDATNPKVIERLTSLGWTFEPSGHPVEFLSLSGKLGAQVRATTHSFGPLLLGKVLDLNDTQTSILSLVFKYCDDNELPLLDLKDLRPRSSTSPPTRASRSSPTTAGCRARRSACSCARSSCSSRRAPTSSSASPSSTSPTCCARRPTARASSASSSCRTSWTSRGLFSTFMLWMLAQLYETLPEVGDLPKPKLCFFFDEAHLLFDDASQALLDQIERTARLIRSKGVGVYFVTQAPTDVPSSVLAQLGNRVQHALRRVHARRRRRAAQDRADVPDDDLLRRRGDDHLARDRRGAGDRALAAGRPDAARRHPAAAARLARWRRSTDGRVRAAGSRLSPLAAKYGTTIDRESAHEMITARLAASRRPRPRRPPRPRSRPACRRRPRPGSTR